MTRGRPPYRLAFCPRLEAERALGDPAWLRARFSPAELSELMALPERRRLDRTAGRLAAKRALAAHFLGEYGWNAEPAELAVFNDDAGRPRLALPKDAPAPEPSFSISHCAQGGAAAVASPGRRVGVDIETILSRPAEVIAFVASPGELPAGPSDPEGQARLWTGKEATLKMLGLGLDADARAVRPEAGGVALTGAPAKAWAALGSPRVRLDYDGADGARIAVAYTGD
ncbi:MAG: 4'-phosphopantetheinyl transferase superfamily protein [Elusimicrobia bacterium]|nr:4'-phosphopantetheinyl transferase superfamily protein [Elusimicrobiota bacterium]